MNEAANEGWSARTFDRNIGTQYYYRLLQSPQKEKVIEEMQQETAKYQKMRGNAGVRKVRILQMM